MKRILHIVGGMDRAGAETMIMNLYRKLDRDNYQFDFVYFRDADCDYDKEILALGGRIFRIPMGLNPISRTIKLKKLIRKKAPFHAVHCHMLFSNALHILAAYFAKIDMRISHSHNTSDVNSKSKIGRIYQSISKKIMAKYSTHFIACGQQAGEFLFPNVPNINYLLNAIDVESFSENRIVNRNFLRSELNVDSATIIIIQIGRLAPVKNHNFTIEFAKHLKDNNQKFKVVIVGTGNLKDVLQLKVKELDLENEVLFLGVRSDIPNILAGTDIMLMPSFHEGFPVVLVETQASGVPSLIAGTISSEVELGMDMVQFLSLEDSFSIWQEKLKDMVSNNDVAADIRLDLLSKEGFNINNSIKKLERIYG